MASASSSQHRCVFVGNIPYDATEEQLVQICEEVGPVVSFRLVLDRETGKPKGYGFCEYKDEETALSARRNLQGYEINGRQLRVDFASNDKGVDRDREQGRGGPGLTSYIDGQKSLPGTPVLGDAALHQPIGLPLASTAASVMARLLGGPQSVSLSSIQNGLQNFSGLGNDPLTHHLSKMSRHQLNEIMSEMKTLTAQNKPLAEQMLQGNSQLSKALFQAQIMLGLMSPQMMQMASSRLSSGPVLQPSLQNNVQNQNLVPPYPGQQPLQKETFPLFTQPPISQLSHVLQNSMIPESTPSLQHAHIQPQGQHPSPQTQVNSLGSIPGKFGDPTVPLSQHHPLVGAVQKHTPPLPPSKSLISQIQPPLLQQPRQNGAMIASHHPHLALPSTSLQQSLLPHPPTHIGSSKHTFLLGQDSLPKEVDPPASGSHDSSWSSRISTHSNSGVGLVEQTAVTSGMSGAINHSSKRPRLEDGNGAPQEMGNNSSAIKSGSGQPIATSSVSGSQTVTADSMQQPDNQMPQLPPEVQSSLLQQVMSLTPEQLSSLPLEQRQQVLQLQQMLR